MSDIFKDFTLGQIEELREIEQKIGGKYVNTRPQDELVQAKKSLDSILPDDKNRIYLM